jgi:hypothetical protein
LSEQLSPSNYFISNYLIGNLVGCPHFPWLYQHQLLISTYYELESRRIWFRLKSEEYIMAHAPNLV